MIVGRPDRGVNGFVFVFYYPCLFLEFKKLIAGEAVLKPSSLNKKDHFALAAT